MPAGYVSGKFAIALCDQCGQRFKLNALIKDWKGFKVCLRRDRKSTRLNSSPT